MLKLFIKYFSLTAFLALILSAFLFLMEYNAQKVRFVQIVEGEINIIESEISSEVLNIGKGINRISKSIEQDNQFTLDLLQRDLLGLMNSRPHLLQARLLNNDGVEIVRFERKNGSIVKCPDSLLQDKSNRKYVADNLNLAKDRLVLTSIEPNKEKGAISRPVQFVTRWITPLYDQQETRHGLLVLNIDINAMLRNYSSWYNYEDRTLYFKDYQGNGFVYDAAWLADSFAIFNNDLQIENYHFWNTDKNSKILISKNAQLINAKELESSDLKLSNSESMGNTLEFQLGMILPAWVVFRNSLQELQLFLWLNLGILIIIGISIYWWAYYRVSEKVKILELEEVNRRLSISESELNKAKNDLEFELSDNKRLLAAFFNYTSHHAGILDTNGNIININKATRDAYGVSIEDVIGKKIWEFPFFGNQEDVRNVLLHKIPTVLNGESISYEIKLKNRQGEYRYMIFSLSPLKNENDEVIYIIPEGVYITDIKEKDRQLKALIQMLETRNKQLKNFSYIVSHNIRTPITNLNLLIDILQNAPSDAERAEVMDLIVQVNMSMNGLLEELLETVRILENDNVKSEMVSVGAAVEEAKKLLSTQIEQSNATISYEAAKDDKVFFPKVYLNSLLLNLMSNAIKYRSNERDLKIVIALNKSNGKPELHFSDNGLGIDLEQHGNKIFGLNKTFHPERGGKGVGLFMTKTQVEASGGDMYVSSKPDEGTTFSVRFPMQA